jgi:hypothetical protein
MGGIYNVCHWNGLRGHDVHTKFHDIWFRYLRNIMFITTTVSEAIMLALLIKGFIKYAIEIASCGMIYIQSFKSGIQAILRLCFRNMWGCNVGIYDGRDYEFCL